ncbi:ComEC/Rec2 family competence protein [Kocuria sp. TGY1127_2]|uniref:ComEC/Rec2 family competence protein n=1 Tax=Kocuria sp. TGY1127_2 TaxID=2711328 RepID=UPI0015BAC0CF|nr:ComEC/Rec2 family competence protein [Kocuria sp. TGY1127_2]
MSRILRQAAERALVVRCVIVPVSQERVVETNFAKSRVSEANLVKIEGRNGLVQGSEKVTVFRNVTDRNSEKENRSSRASRSAQGVIARIDMADDGRFQLRILAEDGLIHGYPPEGHSPNGWAGRLRKAMSERTERLLPSDVAALTTGMSYGDDADLSEGSRQALRTAGLTHLTAVSGSNVGLVFMMGVHMVRWTKCPRNLTILAGIGAVWGYVNLVGPDPSILRAASMGIIGGTAMILGRAGTASSALWVSIVGLLCADHQMATDVGFVLSVLATAGILVQGPPLSRVFSAVLPRLIADLTAMTIVATLWCAPVLVWLSGYWSLYTVVANLVVAPVVPAATLCGILATILPMVPVLSDCLVMCVGMGASWIDTVARMISSWPVSRIRIGSGTFAIASSVALSVSCVILTYRLDPARGTRSCLLY